MKWMVKGKPTPITALSTPHLYEILRFLIRRSEGPWRKAMARTQLEELADGPIVLAENGRTFDYIMGELEDRNVDWQSMYTELRNYSRGLVKPKLKTAPLFEEVK